MGLGCLLLLCVASRGRADGDEAEASRPKPQRVSGAVADGPAQSSRLIIPPFMRDVRGTATTTALFPFYFDRLSDKEHERLILPYYYKRSSKLQVDVALGLIWSLRGPERNTFVLPPLYTHRNGKDWGVGLLPLFSTGVFGGHHHTVIPPLLTWIDGDGDRKRRTLVGPYFDFRDEKSSIWGFFPLLWGKGNAPDRFVVVPPLYWHFAGDDPLSRTTVVPPFYHKRRKDETSWGLVPLVFGSKTPTLRSLTIPFALFHHANGPDEYRLVTPLMSYLNGKDGKRWFTPVYQRKRGHQGFDAVAPFYFHSWDQRDKSQGMFVPPIFWRWSDPANDTLVVFPFMGRRYRAGISNTWVTPLIAHSQRLDKKDETWWVLPTFQYTVDQTSWQFNIHPLVYRKQAASYSHFVLAPLWFDFRNKEKQTHRSVQFPLWWNFKNYQKQTFARSLPPIYWDFQDKTQKKRNVVGFPLYWDFANGLVQKRTTVAFPFYARIERGSSVGHLALNTYFERRTEPSQKSWQFHFFPLLSLGRGERGKEDDRWWSLFYGLAGYERRGEHRRVTAFWLPFNLK